MLNIQNWIILIVLMATVLFRSSMPQPGSPPENPPHELSDEDIETFAAHVEHFKSTRRRVDAINHLNSWIYWNQTSYPFKRNCVFELWNELLEARPIERVNEKKLGQLAYKALVAEIKRCVADDLESLTNNHLFKAEMQLIYESGNYIKFAAYSETVDAVSKGVIGRQLMERNPHMSDDEANLVVILQAYLTRVA